MALHVRCPHEISGHIVSFLSQHDLTSVSCVCHQLQEISQPVLYKEPFIITGSQPQPSLILFLRTILTPGREKLATHVRWLTLHWTETMYLPDERTADGIELFTAAAYSFGVVGPCHSGGAQAVLLIHLLPRLHTLHVIPAHDRDKFDEFIADDYVMPAGLQLLREFRWYSADRHSGVSPAVLLRLLRLPCIRTIDVHMVTEIESPSRVLDAATEAIGTSAATHLEFTFGDISLNSLTPILKIPRALTHFTYRGIAGNLAALPDVGSALAPLRSSLQHLDLDLFRCINRSPQGAAQSESIGSLREWPVLRNVRCSLMALLGKEPSQLADVLPFGLHALETVGDSFWTVEEVAREVVVMLQRKQSMLPGLKTVAVHVDWLKSPEMVGRLEVACVRWCRAGAGSCTPVFVN